MRTSRWSASSSAGGRVCGVVVSSPRVGPIVRALRTSTHPVGVFHAVAMVLVPGSYCAGGRHVDPERTEPERCRPRGRAAIRTRWASRSSARTASRSRRRRRSTRRCDSSTETRSRRSAGTVTAPPRSAASARRRCRRRRRGAHVVTHGSCQRSCPASSWSARSPRPLRYGSHRRRLVEQRLHHPPGLLDAVLSGEPGAVARSSRRAAAPRTGVGPSPPSSANSMSRVIGSRLAGVAALRLGPDPDAGHRVELDHQLRGLRAVRRVEEPDPRAARGTPAAARSG